MMMATMSATCRCAVLGAIMVAATWTAFVESEEAESLLRRNAGLGGGRAPINVPFPVKKAAGGGGDRQRGGEGGQPPPPHPPQQDSAVYRFNKESNNNNNDNKPQQHKAAGLVQQLQEKLQQQDNNNDEQQQFIAYNKQQQQQQPGKSQKWAEQKSQHPDPPQQRVQVFNQGGGRDQQKNPVGALAQRRQEDQRVAQEAAFRQQEQQRQQQQERVRQQQEAIRRQLEEQEQFQQQQKQQQQQQQQQQRGQRLDNINNFNKDLHNLGGDSPSNNRKKADDPKEPSRMAVPTPRVRKKTPEDWGSVVEEREADDTNKDAVPRLQPQQNLINNNNNNGGEFQNINNNNNNRQSDNWQGGLRKVPEMENNNNNNNDDSNNNQNNNDNEGRVPRERYPSEQLVKEVGGIHINWDWDDFSITFDQYGAAEMKVRRAHHATTGEPWPLPQYYTKKDKNILVVDPDFQFTVTSNFSCDVIDQAIERYRNRIRLYSLEDMYDNLQNAEGTYLENPEPKYHSAHYQRAPVISTFSLKIRKPCSVFPTMESDESYDLVIKKSAAYLWANEVWGLLRGLETLSQLVWRGLDDRLYIKESVISDYPRFPHRGILLDSSRHFIYKEVLFDMMDAMEMNKMNVLHWHIVDDQSFPYESQVYPELSAKGAYHPSYVYSLQDIADLLEYARMRGIRIVPEFDSPGHTYSWGLSRPELLTQCYSGSSAVKGYLGPIQPVRNSTYHFLKTLFAEILHVFKDQYIHLGGDEVPLGCWQSNPEVSKFGEKLSQDEGHSMNEQSLYFGGTSPGIRLVYEYYVNRLMKDIKDLGEKRNGVKFIMWQEVMNNDLKLPNDTLIQVWMGDMADVSKAISKGYNVLYSSCWYLDHVEYGVKWPKYYGCDPADASYGYNIDEKKVKGGEACLWSEYIDNENLIQTTWPRASAVAERLWSSKDTRNLDLAGERLSEHRCRMLRRGLSVGQVSGPDYCLKRGPRRGNRGEAGCQGDGCKSDKSKKNDVEENSDIQFRVRSQGRASSECTWMGGNITLLAIVAVIAFVFIVSVSHGSGKLNPLRACRQRTLLLVFVAVVLIYFMCYTTMWMHVFEFSGSFHKKRPAVSVSSS